VYETSYIYYKNTYIYLYADPSIALNTEQAIYAYLLLLNNGCYECIITLNNTKVPLKLQIVFFQSIFVMSRLINEASYPNVQLSSSVF